jgi:hypothetical protein
MQSALRPYVTAGVALVGASAIAVTPVTAPPSAVEGARDTAVHLSALVNPIDVFGPIFQAAIENAQAAGQEIANNPAPILTQIIANQIAGIGNIGAALEAQVAVIPQLPQLLGDAAANELANLANLADLGQGLIQSVIATLTGTALTDQFGLVLDSLRDADLGGAFQGLFTLGLLTIAGENLGNLEALFQLPPILQQPLADAAKLFPIAAGPLNNLGSVIGALPTAALGPAFGALNTIFVTAGAIGNTLDGFIEAAQAGDPEIALNAIITQAGVATGAALDGLVAPFSGLVPGLQSLREAIAAAITPPQSSLALVSKVPSSNARSFTLTAPAVKALPAPTAGSPSVDAKSGTRGTDTTGADAKDTTATGTKDKATGGNILTPGDSSTKGRHRAENGPSFGKEIRDAIKGLTGLGRSTTSDKETSGASAPASSESGSSSSGSGDSGSSGGSGSE